MKRVTIVWQDGVQETHQCEDNSVHRESHGFVLTIDYGDRKDNFPLIGIRKWIVERLP
ncbi:MAG TPA: hypothetical protein PKJ68_06605 [Candidatus Woesebacteria bacterium]|nr:hypothetical protein [Candidatus Woesebacteria bacterium]